MIAAGRSSDQVPTTAPPAERVAKPPISFQQACELGLEGIVSKRKDSRFCSGRSPHWIKSKNPRVPAVKREVEED